MGTSSFPIGLLAVLLLVGSFPSGLAYRLNVPRVLLPYHPTVPVSFILEVTHPSGGCFFWRSTRPDIVSVKSLGASGECSDKAGIRSVAKPGGIGTSELSAVIFAEDRASGTTLSCGVTVDEISTISIETTTKVLFVDAAPARMTVDAFNKEGDRFSTLSEIALEWELTTSSDAKPLRIVPFEQSTYEAPTEIVKLEKNRKKGYLILIEGVGTGSATLTTKFSDSYLQKVKSHQVELAVVANLLLVPAQDIYLPVNGLVPFQVLIVKQKGTEVVPMPSAAYHLELESTSIASLDTATSSVRALVKGQTKVHLLSNNVDVRAKTGLRPPSTVVNVVDAESLQWRVEGDNWMLQTGKSYAINVELLDEHGNVMYIGDTLKFETLIDKDVFLVEQKAVNGSWFIVTPLKKSKTVLSSKFIAVIDEYGREIAQSGRVHGDQKVTIVDPVEIVPPVIYLPYIAKQKSTINLKANGGSGHFEWSVVDSTVASVDVSSGKLTANNLGDTKVAVKDMRNSLLEDEAEVHVLEVAGIGFGETAREAFVGHLLVLNIKLEGLSRDGQHVAFSDCRSADIRVEVTDSNLLRHAHDAHSMVPTVGTGCGTVTLNALASGDTRVVVYYGHLKASIDVSVYEKLQISNEDTAIALGSDHSLQLIGGPRPWILDSNNFYRNALNSKKLRTSFEGDRLVLHCGSDEATEVVQLTVGNEKSSSLPLPVYAEVSVTVCCTKPTRLEIIPEEARPIKCPVNVNPLLVDSTTRILLRGHGVCAGSARQLQSINGVEAKWTSSDSKLLKIEGAGVEHGHAWARISSKSEPALVTVKAEVGSLRGAGKLAHALSAKYEVVIARGLSVEPSKLVLWNEAISTGTINVVGGSGHFGVDDESRKAQWPVTLQTKGRGLLVTPRDHGQVTLRIRDSCFAGQSTEVTVRIADIHSLAVVAPQFVEIDQEVEVEIVAQDETGTTFAKEYRALAEAQLEASNSHAKLRKIEGLRYALRADSIGTVSLTATAKSSSGRALTSRPRVVQIFSPIFLQPKRLTLIPESTFQLEVVGGPQPTPPLDFALNNTKIATIEPNALITSRELGYTSITGTVRVGDGHVTKDTVFLRVVSLSGVTISASARRVEAGGRLNTRLRGLVVGSKDEEPFAFGGALYPFKVTWSVSDPSVLRSVHPLGGDVNETSHNQFAIWFDALRAGSVTVKVRVDLNAEAKKHFVGSATVFTAETTITVEQPLFIVQPQIPFGVVRIAPNSQLQLQTAWPQTSVAYSIPAEYSTRVAVSLSGALRSAGREGVAVVAVRRQDSPDNETTLVPITVSRVYSLDVRPLDELYAPKDDAPIFKLPVGAKITLEVTFRDARGRTLAAAANKINYRPHRFDLTDISATNNNHTLTIVLKAPGETVLQISDAAIPEVATFVRLSAAEVLLPAFPVAPRELLVSDLLCLKEPLAGEGQSVWSSKSSSEGRVQWYDGEKGVGRLAKAGSTFLETNVDGQQLHSKIVISDPHSLRFVSQKVEYVSNDEAKRTFGVIAISNLTGDEKTGSVIGECTAEQTQVLLDNARPPFECFVSFVGSKGKTIPAVNWLTSLPVFVNNIGYACEVSRFDQSTSSLPLAIPDELQNEKLDIVLTARWNLDGHKVEEAKLQAPFYFALRAEETEIVVSNINYDLMPLSIWAPQQHVSYVVARGCEGDIVTVTQVRRNDKHSALANVYFGVKLNVKSAALFSEHAKKCHVTVENTKTGQTIKVPVKVTVLDEASKHVYNALESKGIIDLTLIVLQKYSYLLPSLIWTSFFAAVVIGVVLYIKYNVLEKKGSFNDSMANNTSMHHTSVASSIGSANGSSFFRDSPIFRSTPIAGSPALYPRRNIGSSGDGKLWSTNELNKRN